ncbi:MAG: hypothetical protein ACTSW2_02165 [Alphaproteobacteria bacterium]
MKPANLTSTLLTRKGQASPTLVGPAGVAMSLPALSPAPTLPLLRIKDVPPDHFTEALHRNIEIDQFTKSRRPAVDRRVHMSLRLDPGRHLRLRLESSRTGRSMQSLLLQALDEFLRRDGPGTSDPESAHTIHNGRLDMGSRREPTQTIGVEADGGSTRSQ